jgi:hypothetical protein
MSPFEFFFSFYGLLLGFSVAELVSGFARLVHERKAVRFGMLTPLLGVFVAVDIASFWVQAWLAFRGAPFNYALLVLGLVVASVFYISASMVFPRQVAARSNLDTHFWEHRRWVFLGVLSANLIMVLVIAVISARSGEFARIISPTMLIRTGFFLLATLAAALINNRRCVLIILAVLVAYQVYGVIIAGAALLNGPAWSMLAPA